MQIGPRIQPLQPLTQDRPLVPLRDPTGAAAQGSSFKDLLFQQLSDVNQSQQSASRSVEALLTGQNVNQAEVLTAVQKADLSFRLLLQVRNKLMEAYTQLTQMQI